MATSLEIMEIVLSRFKALQERHIKILGDGKTDIKRLVFERDRAFEDLRSCLSAIPKNFKSSTYKHQIAEILETDVIIKDKIKLRLQELSSAIKNGQKGKKALKGYQGGGNSGFRVIKTTG